MSDLNELKEIAYLANEAGQGSPAMVEFRVSATPDVVIDMINQLEAAQQRIAELNDKWAQSEIDHCDTMNRAQTAEAELARRNAAAGEPVGKVTQDGAYTVVEWVHGGKSIPHGTQLFTATQPSALPPQKDSLSEPAGDRWSFAMGYNQAIADAKALGCKAIKLPEPDVYEVNGTRFFDRLNEAEVIAALKAQGFTVEGE